MRKRKSRSRSKKPTKSPSKSRMMSLDDFEHKPTTNQSKSEKKAYSKKR